MNIRKIKRSGMLRGQGGFTLLEILIVLVIIAVIAGLAVPAYTGQVEKSRSQEALQGLSAARDAMIRYHAFSNTYVGAAFGVGYMDYNPGVAVGGQNLHFSYALSGLSATDFTITATRILATGETGTAPTGTVAINAQGLVSRTGVYNS